jgi:hypothetical protein
MENWIGPFICAARNFLDQGFRSLPTILGGATLLLGLTQGNLNFLFFFVGLFIVAPLAALIANGLLEFLFSNILTFIPQELWLVKSSGSDQCSIFTTLPSNLPTSALNAVPSYWMTIMAFFFFYLFANAVSLYTKQSSSKAPKEAIDARKAQAMIGMILLAITGVVFTIIRYAKTGCETGLGVLVSILMGGSLGYGWYEFMRACGLGRLDDLFGISNRILPLQSYEDNTPVTCVPTAEKI